MSDLYKLSEKINEEIDKRDLNGERFNYMTDGLDDTLVFYNNSLFQEITYDNLQTLENIKFFLEDMIFNCQTAIYAIESVKKEV